MKTDLTDITFLLLVRIDSIDRLENIIVITETLSAYFNTTITVLEVASHNNKILKRLLKKGIQYQFINDKDPILYKTKYYNIMINQAKTPYVALWDVDIAVDKNVIIKAYEFLKAKKIDIAIPYNGQCYDVSEVIKLLYIQRKDIRLLKRHHKKMNLLCDHPLVGGVVMANKEKFILAGLENENHYGWGNDDFDRYHRFTILNYRIWHANVPLFHLTHLRGINSQFHSYISKEISSSERFKTESSSIIEIKNSILYKATQE